MRSLGMSLSSVMLCAAAQGDVGVHLLHAGELEMGNKIVLRLFGPEEQFAGDARLMDLHRRDGPGRARGADKRDGHFRRDVVSVEEDAFAGGKRGGETGEQAGELVKARVGHGR